MHAVIFTLKYRNFQLPKSPITLSLTKFVRRTIGYIVSNVLTSLASQTKMIQHSWLLFLIKEKKILTLASMWQIRMLWSLNKSAKLPDLHSDTLLHLLYAGRFGSIGMRWCSTAHNRLAADLLQPSGKLGICVSFASQKRIDLLPILGVINY